MTSSDDLKKTIRRSKLLDIWAAEKMGITGRDAEDYSDTLAMGTLDHERSEVFRSATDSTPRAWPNRTKKS
jgi:hypothetical protein